MATWVNLLDIVYPIGSIYQSTNSTSPASIIGGTWSAIQGRFLLGQSNSYAVNSQKGAATVTLTTKQMPSHGHTFQMNGTLVGWTGNSPGWVCTWDAPNSWGDGYPNGTYDAYTNLEQGTRIIGLTGGGASHENMPPYYVVYIWRRTA